MLILRLKKGQDEPSWEEFLRNYRPYGCAIIRKLIISSRPAILWDSLTPPEDSFEFDLTSSNGFFKVEAEIQ